MRLSGLVIIIAAFLLISPALQAEHSFAGGAVSAGGPVGVSPQISTGGVSTNGFSAASSSTTASHTSTGGVAGGGSSFSSSHASGSSGSSSSHASSAGGASSSHASSGSSASGSSAARNNAASSNSGSTKSKASAKANSAARTHAPEPAPVAKTDMKPEKKGFFSFLRHKKPAPAPEPAIISPLACKIGQNCTRTCTAGKTWNGFGCGLPFQYAQYRPYRRLNDCSALAQELQALRAQMAGQANPGDSARYRSLLSQYEACMQRSRFGSLGFDRSLLANPFLD